MTTNKGQRSVPPAAPNFKPTDLVSVEIAEPFAVFHDGEQRTGTIDNVPYATAHKWMRNRWAGYCWKQT